VPGSGLGLSIVKQVADLHAARIELHDSEFGRGLQVRVLFPPRKAQAEHANS